MYNELTFSGKFPERRLRSLLERIRITRQRALELRGSVRNFMLLFGIQFFLYCVVTINTRAIAQGSIAGTAVTDLGLAALNWVTIRLVASKQECKLKFWGYLLGSICGSTFGIPVSKLFLDL